MMRDKQLAQLIALLPPGAALPREPDSRLARQLWPMAEEFARLDARAADLMIQADPRAADEMLADYERVLGDDPCIGPVARLPIETRRALAHQRWTAQGGATPAYFTGIAAAFGIPITLTESQPFECGVSACDDELIAEDGRFEWIVTITAPTLLTEFEVGVADVGTPLGDFARSPVECLIRRSAPAHTSVYFSYV
ncbi:MAG: YmfQ family protein [Roseococcus sp.]|nr:YmfQ family protein [Roseococcus sp.]